MLSIQAPRFGMAKITFTPPYLPEHNVPITSKTSDPTTAWTEWVNTQEAILNPKGKKSQIIQAIVDLWTSTIIDPSHAIQQSQGEIITLKKYRGSGHLSGKVNQQKRNGGPKPSSKITLITTNAGDGLEITPNDKTLVAAIRSAGGTGIVVQTTPRRSWTEPRTWFRRSQVVQN